MTKSFVRFVGGLFLIAATIGSGAAIGIGALSAGPAGALTTFAVDDSIDAPAAAGNCMPAAGQCTLRDALAAATTVGGLVTITLPALSAGHVYNVDSTNGQLDVSGGGTVTINGGGQSDTILQAINGESTPTTRVLEVDSGTTADISGVTVEDGNLASGDGGGIFDNGNLTLTDSTLMSNSAPNGAGVYIVGGANALTGDSLTGNTAGNGGGFFIEDGTNTFSGDAVNGNTATDNTGGGGAIDDGTNTFTDSSFSNNAATSFDPEGGGVFIDDGTNTFSGDTVTGNMATNAGDGGGFFIDDGTNTFSGVTVNGNSAVVSDVDAGGQGGGFDIDDGTNTFSGGSIDSNHAYEGAGAFLDDGTSTFTQTAVSGNTASEAGGGFWVSTSGIDAPTTITQSTITDNNVPGLVGESPFLGNGGGILSDGCNEITLTNDTITGNTAFAQGGGYFGTQCVVVELGPLQPSATPVPGAVQRPHAPAPDVSTAFLFDTITNNSNGGVGGGGNIQQDDGSTVTMAKTIVAGGIVNAFDNPTAMNCEFGDGGTFTSEGYNLVDDTTCGTPASTDIIGQSPQLGALANNGGPTQTQLPSNGSREVGAVPNATCVAAGVGQDQRGNARGAGTNGSCTIGSVEVGQATAPVFNPNGYRMVADEGGIFDFGLNFNGSLANNHLNAPIVGIANSPGPNGYLMVGSDGGVFALGGANFFGSLCCNALPSPIAAIAATPSEDGYWLAAQNGKIYNFGNTPALPAVQVPSGAHIVGMASTNDGKGLWLTDQLGDVYAVGDAPFLGGMGGIHLNAPVVGIAAAASGQGYILAASDGGTFNFGVGFFGSVPGSLQPGQHLVAPIVGIAVTHSGNGYWMVGADGGLFNYGDAPFLGSIYTAIPGQHLNGPIVGIQHLGAATNQAG